MTSSAVASTLDVRMSRIVWFALLATACHEARPVALPDLEGRRSALLVVAAPGTERYAIHALDLEADGWAATAAVRSDDALYLFAYDEPLSVLALSPGPQPASTDGLKRHLPQTNRTFAANGSERTFVSVDPATLSELFARALLPATSLAECEASGCVALEGPAFERVCRIPCPVRAPDVAPALPDPVDFGECPEGWRALEPTFAEDVPHCAPVERVACAPGTVQLVGDAACRDLGDCDGDLPGGAAVVHVDDGAAPNGDGTEAAPYDELAEAIAAAPNGATIALHPGAYRTVGVASNKDLTIVGRCARRTTITGPNGGPAFDRTGGALSLAALAVASNAAAPAVRSAGGAVTMTDVEVRSASDAIAVVGGVATLSRVRVSGGDGPGVHVEGAASRLDATDLVVEDRQQVGVRLIGSAADFVRLVVDGVGGIEGPVETRGRALFAEESSVTVRESAFYRARDHALAIWDAPAATVEDTYVEVPPSTEFVVGFDLHLGTSVTMARVNVVGGTVGVWALGAERPLVATLEDVRVVDTVAEGIVANTATTMEATRVLVARAGHAAFWGHRSTTTLRHFTLVDTKASDRNDLDRYRFVANGMGIFVTGDGRLDATSGLIRRPAGAGVEVGQELRVFDRTERVALSQVRIEDAPWGGVFGYRGETILHDVLVERVGFVGIATYSRPLTATNVVVRGVEPQTIDEAAEFVPPGLDITKMRRDEVLLEHRDRNGAGLAVGGFGNLYNGVFDVRGVHVDDVRAGIHIANNSQTTFADVLVTDAQIGEDVVFGGKVDVGGVVFRGVERPLVQP